MPDKKIFAGFFLLSSAILFSVFLYAPQLSLPLTEWDQLSYFSELKGSRSLEDGLRLIDYSAARKYWKGDDILYRPLTFVWLAFQNTWFGHSTFFWMLMNLILHLAVLVSFFAALWSLRPHPLLAGGFTLLFASLDANVGLVSNPHLGGYLWAYALFFSVLAIVPKLTQPETHARLCRTAVFLLTLSCFFNEMMIVAAPLIASLAFVYSPRPYKRKTFLTLWIVPWILFIIFYIPHFLRVERFLFVDGLSGGSLLSLKNIAHSPEVLLQWLRAFIDRVTFIDFPLKKHLVFFPTAAFILIGFKLLPQEKRRPRSIPFIILALYLLYLSLMRPAYTTWHSNYFFYCLFLYGIYGILDFKQTPPRLKKSGAVLLIFLVTFEIFYSLQIGADKTAGLRLKKYYQAIEKHIREHQKDPAFRFSILNPPDDIDPEFEVIEGYPDRAKNSWNLRSSSIVYAKYYDTIRPTHTLIWDDQNLRFTAESDGK